MMREPRPSNDPGNPNRAARAVPVTITLDKWQHEALVAYLAGARSWARYQYRMGTQARVDLDKALAGVRG